MTFYLDNETKTQAALFLVDVTFYCKALILFLITVRQCGEPQTVVNARRISRANDFSNGASIRFECEPGFTMEGTDTITCTCGSWSAAPACRGEKIE